MKIKYKVNKIKNWCFEKINKIDNPLVRKKTPNQI